MTATGKKESEVAAEKKNAELYCRWMVKAVALLECKYDDVFSKAYSARAPR